MRVLNRLELLCILCIVFLFSETILAGGLGESEANFIVAMDGSGDFSSVQEAIDQIPDFRASETIVFIKEGVYKEKLILPTSKTNVTIVGESADKTILTYDNYASRPNLFGENMGTTGSSSFFVFGDNFTARNITFENSSGPVGQAVAVRASGDKMVFDNCKFLGFQDTLYPNQSGSRQYYRNCYIEGSVDFIFGWATVWFEECDIFCKTAGYITAASTEKSSAYGFVFNNCRISGDAPEGSVYLGRPWRDYAQTVFLNCYMSEIVHPLGWHNWNKSHAEQTAFYAEFGSYGPGAKSEDRVGWSHQLSNTEAESYSVTSVLGGEDGWNPLEHVQPK